MVSAHADGRSTARRCVWSGRLSGHTPPLLWRRMVTLYYRRIKEGMVIARILVVNDTQEILELFDDLLTEEGYEVILSSFAIQDLDEIDRIKPHLIILDYIFGTEKQGWQMLQKLKMRRSTNTIP